MEQPAQQRRLATTGKVDWVGLGQSNFFSSYPYLSL